MLACKRQAILGLHPVAYLTDMLLRHTISNSANVHASSAKTTPEVSNSASRHVSLATTTPEVSNSANHTCVLSSLMPEVSNTETLLM